MRQTRRPTSMCALRCLFSMNVFLDCNAMLRLRACRKNCA